MRVLDLLAGFEAERPVSIHQRQQPHDAAVSARPAPGEGHEGAALAGDRIQRAARVLDAGNAAFHHERLVRRLPFGEVLQRIMPGKGLVLVDQARVRRSKAVVDQFGRDRMVVGLAAVGDHPDLLVHQPLCPCFVE